MRGISVTVAWIWETVQCRIEKGRKVAKAMRADKTRNRREKNIYMWCKIKETETAGEEEWTGGGGKRVTFFVHYIQSPVSGLKVHANSMTIKLPFSHAAHR